MTSLEILTLQAGLAIDEKRWADAEKLWRQIIEIGPREPGDYLALGTCIAEQKDDARIEEARAAFCKELAYKDPVLYGAARRGLGALDRRLGDWDMALYHQRCAWRVDDSPESRHELVCTHILLDELDRVEEHAFYMIGRWPDDPLSKEMRWCLANIKLMRGDLNGLKEREPFRDKCRRVQPVGGREAPLDFGIPEWDGKPVKRLLLVCEWGKGDMLLFSRFIAPVVYLCDELTCLGAVNYGMRELFDAMHWFDYFVEEIDVPTKRYDAWAGIMSLPALMDACHVIPPTPFKSERLATRSITRLRVGICWAGGSTFQADKWRSTKLADWQRILEVPGVDFVSFYVGDRTVELDLLPEIIRPKNLAPVLTNFQATADEMQEIDLFISVDSSAAHLAGCLDIPTWLMIGPPTDWAWGMKGDRTPWYLSHRLYRAPGPGQHQGSIARIARDLRAAVTVDWD